MAKSEGSKSDKPKRPTPGPRPAYMTYNLDENGEVVVGKVTRKAEEMLHHVSDNPGSKWVRFEIK